jgi:DNA replication and repair protein RecF
MKTESGYFGPEEDIAFAMYEDLKVGLEKDMRLGFTSIGPHRDDIKFTLNGDDVRVFGSQGQQRTVALSLKLAETEMFYNRFNEYPILILDDVLSELDKKRQRKLISSVEHMQTVFTATGLDRTVFKDKKYQKITVENGKIKGKK